MLPQRPRKDKRLHAGQGALPRARHALEGPASDEDRVELFEQGAEVDVGIHDDPVGFALRPRDVPVQTGRDRVPNPSHRRLPTACQELRGLYHADRLSGISLYNPGVQLEHVPVP